MNKDLSPIVLFAYNRPKHTLEVLRALSRCKLSENSMLYIFCDGAKGGTTKKDTEQVKKVRSIVRSKKWCGKVVIRESKKNKGLAKSILQGVTQVINRHGKIIVLEDDIVPMPGFLEYMNAALDKYEKESKVMQVSAYVVPYRGIKLPATFFYTHANSWGWGTWKRVWDILETDDKKLLNTIKKQKRIKEFDLGGSYAFSSHLKLNIEGKIKTWAIKLVATIFTNNGLCLYPGSPIVKNIGFDGTGIHSGVDKTYNNKPTNNIEVKRIPIEINYKALKRLKKFYVYRNSYYKRLRIQSDLCIIKDKLVFKIKDSIKIMMGIRG